MPVNNPDTKMYRIVQITSDPRMPIGMSRCGFFASWAAVETASNPIYAKKITPAARAIPDQPYSPNAPWFGGINGCQFAAATVGCLSTNAPAMAMKIKTIVTLTITIAELKLADSLMPITRISVIRQITRNATILNTPVTCGNFEASTPFCLRMGAIVVNSSHLPSYWTRMFGTH